MPGAPEFLYRYRSMTSLRAREDVERILVHRQIHFSSPAWFNDPFDCKVPRSRDVSDATLVAWLSARCWRELRHRIEVESGPFAEGPTDLQVAQRREELWPTRHVILDQDVAVFQQYVDNCGVLSLSERSDDILLWSHYADSHRGICLRLRHDALRFSQDPDRRPLPMYNVLQPAEQVEYSESYPATSFVRSPPWEWYRAWMLTKSSHWCYEREWRVTLQPKKPEFEDRVATFTENRHDDPQSLPANALVGVILGCAIKREDERTVREWLRLSAATVPLFRASKKLDRFELEIVGD